MLFCSPRILYGLHWHRTLASTLRGRRETVWVMVRSFRKCSLILYATDVKFSTWLTTNTYKTYRLKILGALSQLSDKTHKKTENTFSDVLLTVHLSVFILIFNQLDAQNLFHSKFYFMPLQVSSTCAHHQEVKITLHSLWYHQTYRWPSRAPDGHL